MRNKTWEQHRVTTPYEKINHKTSWYVPFNFHELLCLSNLKLFQIICGRFRVVAQLHSILLDYSVFQLSVESKLLLFRFCIALLCDWPQNSRQFFNHREAIQNQSRLARAHFPALCASYVKLLRTLIGSLRCLRLLCLMRIINLVLVLRHSIENRSTCALFGNNSLRKYLHEYENESNLR